MQTETASHSRDEVCLEVQLFLTPAFQKIDFAVIFDRFMPFGDTLKKSQTALSYPFS
tara:strand:+ start:308 stop:478 length:171 start_codon:yes stop_codon:yes gene_type:complete